ncbi:MAG: MAPEG family protein, partial [Arenimonas sp.]
MITMLYAGLCTILVVFLALRVVQWRFRHKIGLGDGGDPQLLMRVRAHANAVENLPLALLLLGGMELNGYSPGLIHGFGATLFVSRLAHSWGLSHRSGTSRGRFLGSLFTWLLMLAMAAFAIGGYAMQFVVTAA